LDLQTIEAALQDSLCEAIFIVVVVDVVVVVVLVVVEIGVTGATGISQTIPV